MSQAEQDRISEGDTQAAKEDQAEEDEEDEATLDEAGDIKQPLLTDRALSPRAREVSASCWPGNDDASDGEKRIPASIHLTPLAQGEELN